MKKSILTLVLLIIALLSVSAQKPIVHSASNGDFLELNYTITPAKPGSAYSLVITPMLCGLKDTVRLEPTIIRGTRNARKYHRDMRLNHKQQTELPYRTAKQADPIVGQMAFDVHNIDWIKEEPLTLCVLTEQEGCCKVETLSVECSDPIRYEAPKKVFTFVPALADVADDTGVAGALMKDNPVLEHISKYRPYDSSRILRKEKGMLYVHFPLDKTDLRRDFRDNASILDRIVDITRQIMADSTSHVEKIQIVGLASVEGPQKRNNFLGEGRAEALKDYVQARVDTPDELYECINGGEAWTELRDQINDSDSHYRQQMLDIIDSEPNLDRREAKLKALDRGKAYAYLRDNVLSDQRNSGYVRIYYDYVPDAAAATINKASALLRQEKYDEALALLRTVQSDQRAQNALGVALYMTGDKEAGIRCFEAAASNGNAEAIQNLKQLQEN